MSHKGKTNNYTEFYHHFFRNILLFSIPTLIVSVLVLSSLHSSATNSANDNLSLSIPVSCSLSATVATGEEHTISMVAGTYEDEIGKTTINTTCNDPNGYVVYAIGNTRNNEGDNVLAPSTISDTYGIPTGTNTSGNTSQWAMKLTAIDSGAYTPTVDNGYSSYSLVPNSWVKVAHKDPGTTDVTKNSAFTTTYAIYLEGSQPAGNYNGQVKYVMLHPSTAPHPTDTIEHAFALAGKTKLILKTDGTVVPETSPEAEDIPVGDIVGRYYKMQDMETSFCENTSKVDEQNTTQLIDIRDNKTYWVIKLQDGHCWMTQNLALDLGMKDITLGIDTTILTSEDTDLTDHSLSGAYHDDYAYNPATGITTWTPANSTISFQNNTVSGWINSNNVPYSASKTDSTETGHASLGNWYNWSATIASNNSSSLTTNTYSNIQNNPKNSICPKGWRLPTISNQGGSAVNSTNEFARLNYLYNGSSSGSDAGLIAGPLYFTYSGRVISSSLGEKSLGFYQSSTVHPSRIFVLMLQYNYVAIGSDWVGAGGVSYRYTGFSIRCLAR